MSEIKRLGWLHSITMAPDFVSEWEANEKAAELQVEVYGWPDPEQMSVPRDVPCRQVPTRRERRVTISDEVRIFLGEDDRMTMFPIDITHQELRHWLDKPWKHGPDRPAEHDETEDDDDISSMLAHGAPVHRLPAPQQHPQGNHGIAADPQAALQHEDPEDQADEMDDGHPDTDAESSSSPSSRTQKIWQSVHVFSLHLPTHSFRARWDTYEALHRSIARGLRLQHHEIAMAHEVSHPPADLEAAQIVPALVQMGDDLAHGETQRYVLLDVEFHDVWPSAVPEVSRSVRLRPQHVHRTAVFDILGLKPYCSLVADRCLLWHNGRYVSQPWTAWLRLRHGDYLRVVVPPLQDDCHVPTRRAAAFALQGSSSSQIRYRWRTETSDDLDDIMPSKRTKFDKYTYDSDNDLGSLIQAVQRIKQLKHQIPSIDRCRIDGEVEDWEPHVDEDDPRLQQFLAQRGPERPAQQVALDPVFQHGIDAEHADQVRQGIATEVTYVTLNTWYVSGLHRLRCPIPREVRLGPDPGQWQERLLRAWHDWIDPAFPVELHHVHPRPPKRQDESHAGHVILVQHTMTEQKACLVSNKIYDADFQHMAVIGPLALTRYRAVMTAHLQNWCYRGHLHHRCQISSEWEGIEEDTNRVIDHGFSYKCVAMAR